MNLVRAGEAADLEECVALAVLAAPERSAAEWRESLVQDLESAERHLVVAAGGSGIVGYGRARLFERLPPAPAETAPRGYYLAGLFVQPDHRRAGLGSALTRARLAWIARRADEAWFFTNARNTPSLELHRRLGFEGVTRRFCFPAVTFRGGEGVLLRARLQQPT